MSNDVFSPPDSDLTGEPPMGRRSGSGATPAMVETLESTRPWVLIIAIMGFLVTGLMLLGSVAMIFLGGALLPHGGSGDLAFRIGMGCAYMVFVVIYLPPPLYLWRFAKYIGKLDQESDAFELALEQQRKFWKYVGVLTGIIMVLYLFFFLVSMVGMIAA